MTSSNDLPEGVIDADPPGGWASGDSADGETAEQNADAAGSPLLTDSGADALEDEGDALDRPDAALPPDAPIESDEPGQGADPDLAAEPETHGGAS